MAQVRKIFHVEFREPIDGKKHYYLKTNSGAIEIDRYDYDEVSSES